MVAVNLYVRFVTKIVTRARSAWLDTRSWEVECMVRISYHIMLQIVKRSSLTTTKIVCWGTQKVPQ